MSKWAMPCWGWSRAGWARARLAGSVRDVSSDPQIKAQGTLKRHIPDGRPDRIGIRPLEFRVQRDCVLGANRGRIARQVLSRPRSLPLALALLAAPLRRRRGHLRHHLALGFACPGGALFAPGLESGGVLFEICVLVGFLCAHAWPGRAPFGALVAPNHCSPEFSKKNSSSIRPRFTMLATISE